VKLHTRLLIALALGALLGTALHAGPGAAWVEAVNTNLLKPLGQLFLRAILMVVVPMVVSALILGVYELSGGHALRGVALRTLGYTLVLSTASVLIGVGLVGLIRPGSRVGLVPPPPTAQVRQLAQAAGEGVPLAQALVDLVPRNPLASAVRALDGEMLPLMVFALVFGVALSVSAPRSDGGGVVIQGCEQVFAACMLIVHTVMRASPVAVFALVFGTAFTAGPGVFRSLLLYVLTVVGGLLVQQFLVYGACLRLLARRSPLAFFRGSRDVLLYAFSTASSNATLPLSLDTATTRLGLPPEIARFTLTIGATANQNGTALFEGVTVLFLAQVYGIELGTADQFRVMVMSVLAGIGTAGVPGGSLPMVLVLAQSVGVPPDGMGLILGVDRLLDMCRSAVNVSGDLVIAALVSPHPAGAAATRA